MRFPIAAALWLGLASIVFAGKLPPLTLKDVSLMLRSGYSSDAVEREAATRHFLGSLDAAGEKNLVQAGASPALVSGLKSGAFAIPASEALAVQTELAAKEQRKAAALEESRKLDTLYQAGVLEKRSGPPPTVAAQANAIAALVKGNLVTINQGPLQPYADAGFEKKRIIGLYLSAHWCPPCRQFTPKLVSYYNRIIAAHLEFEIVFVSMDKGAAMMESYMHEDHMPWPALSYDKVAGSGVRRYFGDSIPCLVIVDETGKVISDTYAGGNYRGPEAVLADLDRFFAGKNPARVAQAR